MAELPLDEHPLSLELQSLRTSVARFQEEAHTSAVKLQRHSLDAVRAHERAVQLERENDVLKSELAVQRANPQPNAQSSLAEGQRQVQELTLSLRRLSHKLSLTEEALLAKTTELASAQAQAAKATASAENAYELGARVRGREEEGIIRQRDLERKVRKLEEELKMSDGVVQEYAALVREMEARSSLDVEKPKNFAYALHENKLDLGHLLAECKSESEELQRKLGAVQAQLAVCTAEIDAEKKVRETLQDELGRTRTELDKLRLEDGTAAKMVSRYMQFSQTSTNNLLTTLNALQTRHSSTVSTLTSQNHILSTQIRSLDGQNERLRSALDELGGEIMKETYGRRREVTLRIRMGGREERIVEGLRRWVRRGEEMLGRIRGTNDEDQLHVDQVDVLLDMAQHARILLESLDEGMLDEESALSISGGKARALVVQLGLQSLLDELREQTERTVGLEKRIAEMGYNGIVPDVEADEFSDAAPPQVPEKTIQLDESNLPSVSLPRPSPSPEPDEPKTSLSQEPLNDSNNPTAGKISPPNGIHTPELQFEETAISPGQETCLPEILDAGVQEPAPATVSTTVDRSEVVFQPMTPPNLDLLSGVGTSNLHPIFPLVHDDEIRSGLSSAAEPTPPIPVSPTQAKPVLVHIPNDEAMQTSSVPSITYLDLDDASSLSSSSSLPASSEVNRPTITNSISFPSSSPLASPPPLPPTTLSTPEIEINEEINAPTPHRLLADLARVSKRYEDLQRAFRDCHLALEGLKASLGTSTSHGYPSYPSSLSSSSLSSPLSTPTPILNSVKIPPDVLRAALARLDDYTEDARVELEIRVGDESLLAKGYEALLCIPGALVAVQEKGRAEYPNVSEEGQLDDSHDTPTQSEAEGQIEAFVSGTDPALRKARDTFARKLEDVQHDIAALKRAIHDPESLESVDQSTDPVFFAATTSSASSSSNLVSLKPENTNGNGHGGGWSSWIRGPSSNPAPIAPAFGPSPTFGSIMTSPRLKHSPSTGSLQSQRPRKTSFFGFGSSEPVQDPLAPLGLRVPMPSFGSTGSPGSASAGGFGGGFGLMSPTSSMAPAARNRAVSSTMYMLGLGGAGQASPGVGGKMRSASAGSGHNSSAVLPIAMGRQSVSQTSSSSQSQQKGKEVGVVDEETVEMTEDETEDDEDDTDVE